MRTKRDRIRRYWKIAALIMAGVGVGCASARNDVSYLGDPNVSYYRGHATEIDFPAVDAPTPPEVMSTAPPVTVRDKQNLPVKEMTLSEAVQMALMNSEIIRSAGTFLSTGNALYTNPSRISSVYDPAIQESGVLFGGRGIEAALAAFDAQFQAAMIWGRDEQPQNNAIFGGGVGGGSALVRETGNFTSSLSKTFANGGSISLNHDVNYLGINAPSLFPSSYAGNVNLQYQLPLLAGAGTEFTRVAGPIGQSFGGISGVSQGVLIARINNDISIADFETAVRNLIQDVENTYWDLYLAYQTFDIASEARDSTEELRKLIEVRSDKIVLRSDLYQAEDQYFAAVTAVNNAQSQIYETEIRLRRLLGLPVNDGEIIRPADSPVSVELVADWSSALTEALTHRVELRRQKWSIKSLELQLRAAESLTKPRLDFVGGYQVNGLGDQLLGYDDPPLGNFYESLTGGNFTGWNLGLQMRWDIGFRSAKAQVRNYELQLAKAQKVLDEQQEEISHELAVAFQELARAYQAAYVSYNRIRASSDEVAFRERRVKEDQADPLLRAIIRQGEAKNAYYQNLIAYNKAITNYHMRKGALLRHHGIMLAEGGWDPAAYIDVDYNSDARLHAKPAERKHQAPAAFAVDAPYGAVQVQHTSEPAPIPTEPTEEAQPIQPVPPEDVPVENSDESPPPAPPVTLKVSTSPSFDGALTR